MDLSYRSQNIFPAVHASVGAGISCRGLSQMVGGMFASAWLPVCMSACMHGFGAHWVFVTSIGGEEDVVGFGCVCLQKMVESRSCDLSSHG